MKHFIRQLRWAIWSWWFTNCWFFQHLFQKYIIFWRSCTECHHPNWWHYWSNDKTYCWNRNKGQVCDCGYHCGR